MPEISINTTQNVNINFTVASIGARIGAYLTDGAVKFCYHLLLQWTVLSGLSIDRVIKDDWSMMAIYVVMYLPMMFYTLVQESLMEGQTIGKKLLGIKVVKIDGYQASFFDYLIRWVMRLVDMSASLYMAGMISMAMSKNHQRLGDLAAGTAVISLKNNINISHTILENLSQDYQPVFAQVVRFSDNDMRIIKETYQNAIKNNDLKTIRKLIDKMETVSGIKQGALSDSKFISTIIKDYNYYTGK
ncbi:MAG: RDD family protein [Saprospiraceae bacterium]|jgi:uncharacterized RDD family membrane protein YckC|nr:RDD family protein [Saprospiraceae bacterium]